MSEPIAVIGMSCRLPGSDNLDAYWRTLLGGKTQISAIDLDRWDAARLQAEGLPGSRQAGLIDVRHFDPPLFRMGIDEARQVDPQQLILLELAYEAFEHAHLPHTDLARTQTGVFIGASGVEALISFADAGALDRHSTVGMSLSSLANRISTVFDLRGPSLVVESACSASLSAMHLALQSLASEESQLAIVGGVHVMMVSHHDVALGALGVVADDGVCRPFSADARGMVMGEGGAVVLLKRLRDAQRDGDPILALVHGSAVNHDGRTLGLGRPSEEPKAEVIRAALRSAGASADDLGYVEAHGTGTRVGDYIEARAIARVLAPSRELLIGSVKAHIGHLQAAAGIASIVKCVLAMRAGVVPETLQQGGQPSSLERLQLATAATPWPAQPLCGVSAFGVGGSNAHIILGPAPKETSAQRPPADPRPLFLPISAASIEAFSALRDAYDTALVETQDTRALCDEAAIARGGLPLRAVAIADDGAGLRDALKSLVPATNTPGPIVFVFPGHGPDWRRLATAIPAQMRVFHDTLARAHARLRDLMGGELGPLDQTRFAQPAICAYEIALFEMWRALGVTPDVVLGHSVGEVAAAYAAGVVDLDTALALSVRRGKVLEPLRDHGHLLAVTIAREAAEALVARTPGTWVAAFNGPRQTVIGVTRENADAFAVSLIERDLPFAPLALPYPFHGPAVGALTGALTEAARDLTFAAPRLPWLSTLTGERLLEAPPPSYWADAAARPVLLDAAVERALDHGARLFFELGPERALAGPIHGRVVGRGAVSLAMLHGPIRAHDFWRGAASLWEMQAPLDVRQLLGAKRAPSVRLPAYPFQRTRTWSMPSTDLLLRPITRLRLPAPNFYVDRWRPLADGASSGPAAIEALTTRASPALSRAINTRLRRAARGSSRVFVIDARKPSAAVWLLEQLKRMDPATARVVLVIENGATPDGEGLVTFARAWHFENKTTTLRVLSLDRGAARDQARLVERAICTHEGDIVWKQSGDQLLVPRLSDFRSETVVPLVCKGDATYLITGGLGGLGLYLARHLVARGARHLLLLSRRRLPPRDRWSRLSAKHADRRVTDAIVALEASGAEVRVVSCDVGALASLARVLTAEKRERRPPIKMVLHAAGDPAGELFSRTTAADLRQQYATKVLGLRHLLALCRDTAIVCTSSVVAAMGTARAAAYAHANAVMDGEVARAGPHVRSLRLGPIAHIGMIADQKREALMSLIGHTPLSPDAVAAALDAILVSNERTLLCTTTDWTRLAPLVPDRALLSELVREKVLPHVAPRTEDERRLSEIWCRLLRKEALSVTDNVFELGATSISVASFVAELAREGYRFSVEDVWRRPTIREQASDAAAQRNPTDVRPGQ